MSDDGMLLPVAGAVRPVRIRRGHLELVGPSPLSGPTGIVRDLPPDFWHPSMGAVGEKKMHVPDEFEVFEHDEPVKCNRPHKDETSRAQKAVGCWLALLFVASLTLGFIWLAARVIENL